MYKSVIRPLLFLLSPEKIHELIVVTIRIVFRIPGFNWFMRLCFTDRKARGTHILGLDFPSKVGLAAGFDKNALFYKQFSVFGFGFIEIGTLTPRPQPGNPKPRSFRLPKDKALINRMGFNNMGVDSAVERLKNRPDHLIVGGNIGKNTQTPNSEAVEDYAYCFDKLYDYVDYFVVNVSCPNITDLKELQDQEMLEEILNRLVTMRSAKKIKKPVLLKISPDLNDTQVIESVDIIKRTGIDGVVATNTTVSRENLLTDSGQIESVGNGGLSGKPVTRRSTEVIRLVRDTAGKSLPIIGVGGIMSPEDAKDKIDAGADLIQIYTGFIYEGPALAKRISKVLSKNI